eukprot:1516245-Pyramimonas_sp.AAC.1
MVALCHALGAAESMTVGLTDLRCSLAHCYTCVVNCQAIIRTAQPPGREYIPGVGANHRQGE